MEIHTYSCISLIEECCNRQHRTRTQQSINLSSNVDAKGVDNLEEAYYGYDPSSIPDVAEDHNVEYTVDPHKILKYIVFENSLMEHLDPCPKCTRTYLQHHSCNIGNFWCEDLLSVGLSHTLDKSTTASFHVMGKVIVEAAVSQVATVH
ncbi:hypothetical protein ACJMK2_022784 [Sinanodonta woodiana]|uniref:Uncharacterized protein n=1 Tax=Sinanodonta woodiana TaxID=1069815 RepID=A0ABD3TK91_SINWO